MIKYVYVYIYTDIYRCIQDIHETMTFSSCCCLSKSEQLALQLGFAHVCSKSSSSGNCSNVQLFHAVEATDLCLAIARVARILGRNELKSACLVVEFNC